jgi:hypothetical protein
MISEQVLDQPVVAGATADRLEEAGAKLPRRRFLSDMPDKGLFAFAATLGFLGILLFKLDGFDANYIAAAAVALMLSAAASTAFTCVATLSPRMAGPWAALPAALYGHDGRAPAGVR